MKVDTIPKILPQHGSSLADEDAAAVMMAGGKQAACVWVMLAPRLIHPLKVAILEALLYMQQPLSASQLTALFDDPDYYLGLLDYHLKQLAAAEIVEWIKSRRVRGASERFFYFPTPATA